MNKYEAREFVEKYAENNYSAAEHAAFQEWLFQQPLEEIQPLLDEYTWVLEQQPAYIRADKVLFQRIVENLDARETANPKVVSLYAWKKKLAYAAAVVVLLLAGGIYWSKQQPPAPELVTNHAPQQIKPGGAKAILQLADGSTIALDSAANGTLAQQGNTNIVKLSTGQLSYHAGGGNTATEIAWNVLSTPRGGQYELLLPDGSKAWLNAASSLRFPTTFAGKERNVEMSGEVYFEVAKHTTQPFTVTVNDMRIAVLGTHFNVMAYPDEVNIRTTLLEGAVLVSKGATVKQLAPGQQAILTNGESVFDIRNVEVEQEVAWKEGRFIFNDNIKGIMRQIARWYDVSIVYEGNISNKAFIGDISRKENVAEVLKMLELTGKIHFKIENRKIVVMP
jgi:transmembrane sensor